MEFLEDKYHKLCFVWNNIIIVSVPIVSVITESFMSLNYLTIDTIIVTHLKHKALTHT